MLGSAPYCRTTLAVAKHSDTGAEGSLYCSDDHASNLPALVQITLISVSHIYTVSWLLFYLREWKTLFKQI